MYKYKSCFKVLTVACAPDIIVDVTPHICVLQMYQWTDYSLPCITVVRMHWDLNSILTKYDRLFYQSGSKTSHLSIRNLNRGNKYVITLWRLSALPSAKYYLSCFRRTNLSFYHIVCQVFL